MLDRAALLDAELLVETALRIGRAETAARMAHGWIMDCYLLARNSALTRHQELTAQTQGVHRQRTVA